MITETKLIKEVNLTSFYLRKLIGRPCSWDEKSGLFLINRPLFLRYFIMTGIAAFASYFDILYSYLQSKSGIPMNVGSAAVAFFIAGGIFTTAYFSQHVYREPQIILNFNNGMADFEAHYLRIEKGMWEDPGEAAWKTSMKSRAVIKLAELTCTVSRLAIGQMISPVAAVGAAILPNLPMDLWACSPFRILFAGLKLVTVGLFGLELVIFEKLLAFVFNLLLWQVIVKLWCLLVAQTIAGCMGLSSAILTGIRKFQTESTFLKGVILYREIQMLCEVFRRLVSTLIVIVLIETMCCQIIPSVLILGKTDYGIDISVKMFLVLAGIEGVVGVSLVFGLCADVHHNSNKCIKLLSTGDSSSKTTYSRSKWREMRRVVRSMPVVKVQFGSTNFIEKLTPVVFQHFTTQKIIDCLLVSKA